MAEIKRCKTPFATEVDGFTRVVTAGELVSTDDPVYTRDRRELFEDLAEHLGEQADRRARASGKGVEQATAEPGEKRDLTPAAPAPSTAPAVETATPAKKTAAKKTTAKKTAVSDPGDGSGS